jgi:hypothetical protein
MWLKAQRITLTDGQRRWILYEEIAGKEQRLLASLSEEGMRAFLDSVREQDTRESTRQEIQEDLRCLMQNEPLR